MKEQSKDPRQLLSLWFDFSMVSLILLPFLYFNLKFDQITNLLLIFSGMAIIRVLMGMFYPKDTEEDKLHNSVIIGYMFSGGWFLFASMFIYAITIDYLKQNILPTIVSLTIILVLLFFSFTLFYLSYKSMIYEKKVLHYLHKLQLPDIFLVGLLAVVLLAIIASIVWTFLPLFFSKPIYINSIIADAILIPIFIILLLYAKHRKLFDKL
ncbi:MAG: hypothetical protein IH845_05240 [Nanoarchaeota archaeon]|nr:hypothetical protein [Nanoarchaeota archaeon]